MKVSSVGPSASTYSTSAPLTDRHDHRYGHFAEGLLAREAGALYNLSTYGEEFGVQPKIRQTGLWDCTGNGEGPSPGVEGASIVTCTNDPSELSVFAGGGGTPTFSGEPLLYPQPPIGIAVEVQRAPRPE